MQIRIGTRKSKLAIIQTNLVIKRIKSCFPDAECILVPISTTGDKITDKNLYDIGGKALFLKELEEQLLNKNIDMAVHSLKDVPGILPENLLISAVLKRSDPRDCLISKNYKSIQELPKGAIIGTSSVRRRVVLQKKRPDLKTVQFRGNIHTRMQKLQNGEVDATILACAGLLRSGLLDSPYCHPIEVEEMLPAAGQGVISVEIRSDNKMMQDICNKINHLPTWYLAKAERSFLSYLDASCRTPIAAYAIFNGDVIEANYMISDTKGNNPRYHRESGSIESAYDMGIRAAKILSSS